MGLWFWAWSVWKPEVDNFSSGSFRFICHSNSPEIPQASADVELVIKIIPVKTWKGRANSAFN
jgi:hypothetical protein